MTDPKDLDITLYMAKRCAECKEPGALAQGVCLKCVAKTNKDIHNQCRQRATLEGA